MKQTVFALLIGFGLCTAMMAQSPQDLYNQALIQERAAGNLQQAIQLYQRVAKEASGDRALAAQSLVGAARAYEMLGQAEASRSLYTQVVRAYPEQRDQAAIASQRLAESGIIQGTVTRTGTGEPIPAAKVALSGGPIDAEAFKTLQAFFKNRPNPVDVNPPGNGLADDKFFQNLADTASARGVSLANPGVRNAINQFQAANDARFFATSDDAGHFTIRDVPPGRYTLRTERDGFFPAAADPSTVPTAVVVAGRTAIADVSMLRGATVSGRITDAAGQPQPNTVVQAFSVAYNAGFPVLQPSVAKTTDDKGEYRLFWLTGGEYLIAVVPEADVSAPPPQTTAAPPGAGGGLPAPRTFYPGTADIATAIPVYIRGEAPVSGIDILVRKVSTFHIKGQIRSHVPVPPEIAAILAGVNAPPRGGGGTPSNAAPVMIANMAVRPRNTNTPDDVATPTMSIQLRAVGDRYVGEFDVSGVAPGSYSVRAWAPEPAPDGGAGLAFANADVDVSNGDVVGVPLEIYPTVRVNGSVTIDGSTPGQNTARVGLQADGSLAKAGVYQGLAARAVVASGQTGAFMIPAVPSGHFRITLGSGLSSQFYVADVRQGGLSVFDSGFDVGREPPAPIQVLLSSGARTIEGIVRDAAGKPAGGVMAVLVPPKERRQNRLLYYSAKTDAAGRFKIEGVAPGGYSLFSWQNMPDGAYYNERFVSRNEEAGRRVNVVQASMTGADITLIPSIGK